MLHNAKILRLINDEVSIINIGDSDYILKTRKKISKAENAFEYLVNLGNFSFKRELQTNLAIMNTKFVAFCPRLIYSDYSSILLFEKINAIDGLPGDSIFNDVDQKLIDVYMGFHAKIELGREPHDIIYSLYSLNLSYLRIILSQLKNFKRFIKLLHVYIVSNISQKKVGKYLLHKDLKNYQNIMHSRESIYFIDFANSNYESKWVMADIIDLAFDIKKFTINQSIIFKYMSAIENKKINTYIQVRFVLIRKLLYYINYNSLFNRDLNKELNFIDNVLLKKNSYISWMKTNGLQ